eukprot:SAG22_NODE_15999_length_335_cov_0.661017_1_plen_73_part_10
MKRQQRPPAPDVPAGVVPMVAASTQLDADAELARKLQRELTGLRTVRRKVAAAAAGFAADQTVPQLSQRKAQL